MNFHTFALISTVMLMVIDTPRNDQSLVTSDANPESNLEVITVSKI